LTGPGNYFAISQLDGLSADERLGGLSQEEIKAYLKKMDP